MFNLNIKEQIQGILFKEVKNKKQLITRVKIK